MGWCCGVGQTQGWTEGDQLVNVRERGGGSMQDVDCRLTDQTGGFVAAISQLFSSPPPHPFPRQRVLEEEYNRLSRGQEMNA